MPDSKYGHLYTKLDVEKIAYAVAEDCGVKANSDQIDNIIEDTETVIPRDEPLFLLRGQDDLAEDTINFYGDRCAGANCDADHLHSVRDAAHTFKEFRQDNPDRVKLPD